MIIFIAKSFPTVRFTIARMSLSKTKLWSTIQSFLLFHGKFILTASFDFSLFPRTISESISFFFFFFVNWNVQLLCKYMHENNFFQAIFSIRNRPAQALKSLCNWKQIPLEMPYITVVYLLNFDNKHSYSLNKALTTEELSKQKLFALSFSYFFRPKNDINDLKKNTYRKHSMFKQSY